MEDIFIVSVYSSINKIGIIHFNIVTGVITGDELLVDYLNREYCKREINKYFSGRKNIFIIGNNKQIINDLFDFDFSFLNYKQEE